MGTQIANQKHIYVVMGVCLNSNNNGATNIFESNKEGIIVLFILPYKGTELELQR